MAVVENVLLKKGSGVIAVTPETTVADAALRMKEANVGCVLVEQHPDTIVGIVTERDFLRRVLAEGRDPTSTYVTEIMSSPVMTCTPADDVMRCAELLSEHHIRHLLVIDENVGDQSEPIGLISQRDLLAMLLQSVASE